AKWFRLKIRDGKPMLTIALEKGYSRIFSYLIRRLGDGEMTIDGVTYPIVKERLAGSSIPEKILTANPQEGAAVLLLVNWLHTGYLPITHALFKPLARVSGQFSLRAVQELQQAWLAKNPGYESWSKHLQLLH